MFLPHLPRLATVPLLVAALCSCAPMTPVATLRRPLGTSSAPISAAQAAAVVATVFLADRAAERLLVKRWWVATLGHVAVGEARGKGGGERLEGGRLQVRQIQKERKEVSFFC